MTRNLRTQLADVAERWMRAWAGDDLARESAEVLFTYWDLADPNDDELRDEVLSRFPKAEPPAVPGKDWLPGGIITADAKAIVDQVFAGSPGTVLTAAKVNAAAEAVAVLKFPPAGTKLWRDTDGEMWAETYDPMRIERLSNIGELTGDRWNRNTVEENFGPLVEVPAPVKELPAEPCCEDHSPTFCGIAEDGHDACCSDCPEFGGAS